MYINGSPGVRFWAKVNKTGTCWLWTAATNYGYGKFRAGGAGSKTVLAHRWAWEQEHGPIPAGLELDHLCRIRNCVRPSHMEVVAPRVNKSRQVPNNGKAARTHCKRQHEYTPGNTRIETRRDGRSWRVCITCETSVWGRAKS
jgi:hypothetical protein